MNRYILIAALALLTIPALAQHDEQVTVEGKYRPKVNKVDKLKLNPEMPEPTYMMPSTEVYPKEAKQKFALDLEKIAPTGFASKNDKLVTPTKNFLLAGIGTNLSPVFLYKHNSKLGRDFGLGVSVKHNSSWLNIKDYAPSGFMNNAFDVSLTTSILDGFQIDAGVNYKNDMYHYYGLNLTELPVALTEEQIAEACPRQTYNTIGAHLGLASTSTRVGELRHSGTVDYHHTFDKFDAKEHFVGLEYGLGYTQNWWGDKSHPQKVGVDVGFQYEYFDATQQDAANMAVVCRNDLYLIKVNPYFEMGGEFYKLHLGVRLDGVNCIKNEDKFLAVRPDINGSLYVLNKKLEFYAGLNGGRSLSTFSNVIAENPFVCNQLELLAPNVKFGFEAGVRTNVAEIVDVHLGVRYRNTDNDPLYQQRAVVLFSPITPETTIPIWNSYELIYDTTRLLTVMADVRVKLRNSLTADVGFAYNSCKPTTEAYAWYRPTTEGKLKLTYDINDSWAVNAAFLYQGGRYAKVFTSDGYKSEKMKDVFDLSLGADYKVSDQLTAFALIDNVACQKYQLYYNYPVTGIQLFAGVKLKF